MICGTAQPAYSSCECDAEPWMHARVHLYIQVVLLRAMLTKAEHVQVLAPLRADHQARVLHSLRTELHDLGLSAGSFT